MRLSKNPFSFRNQVSKEAKMPSHKLMLQTGMIRQSANGIYHWLPMGLKVINKINAIIKKSMQEIGFLEILMPNIHKKSLWDVTCRWDNYGPLLLKITDRQNKEYCYGPTHEECVTDLIQQEHPNLSNLPIQVFQIQTKFRDEIRPRHGVMRSREFIMKDGYSFHIDAKCADTTYANIQKAYVNILNAIGLKFKMIKADSGDIGGNNSHEFQIISKHGDDIICQANDYIANIELAKHSLANKTANKANISVYESDSFVFILAKDYEVNHHKLFGKYKQHVKKASAINHSKPIILDLSLKGIKHLVLNEQSLALGVDIIINRVLDISYVKANDLAINEQPFKFSNGIEVAHIFNLGKKYTKAFNFKIDSETLRMGCYGIGVSRLVAATIEQHHDEQGIIWPASIAPFKLHIIAINYTKEEKVAKFADLLYQELTATYDDVVLDDTNNPPKQKMLDANRLGAPIQIIFGSKSLQNNTVELVKRSTLVKETVLVKELKERIKAII